MNETDIRQKRAQQVKQKVSRTTPPAYEKPETFVPIDNTLLKPQVIVASKTNRLIALGIFVFTLVIYMLTQARTMSFWDSGEYATCISILGVPHAPGNPFYILFGKAIVSILGGLFSHAVIAAFISGLTSALAVMFTYLLTVQFTSMFKIKAWEAVFAGVMAALYTAFAFTFWMNAIEAEVYSGLVFFVNLILWLTMVWVQKSDDFSNQNVLLLIIYLFFLGFCVHQTALQVAPAVLFIVVYPLFQKGQKGGNFWIKVVGYTLALFACYFIFGSIGKGLAIDDFDKWGFAIGALIIMYVELKDIIDRRVWILSFALVAIGLSSHIYLMVRAADRPFINEGYPSTLQMFKDYVLRKQYGNTSFVTRRGNFFTDQLGFHFLRYFGMQWFPEGIFSKLATNPAEFLRNLGNVFIAFLGIAGAIFHFRMNKHGFRYLLSIIILTTIVMVFVMNLSNAEVRDRDYFFVVGYNMWAIWLGIGSLALVSLFKSTAPKILLIVLLSAIPLHNFVAQYNMHDRSKEFIALDYGLNFLNSVEENAIIFTNGDNDTFPLWFAQSVADPYSKEYVHSAKDVYPTEESIQAMKVAMEYKNKYLKGIRKDVSIANLSLLNTAWYVRQIRDHEGILFNMSDEEIDNYGLKRIEEDIVVPGPPAKPDMGFSVKIPPTAEWRPDEPFYRIADQAVMQIIKDNFGKRPIYFAVTCESFIGFEDYTRNEGMVARVVNLPGDDMLDINRLITNIDSVYQYRSITDKRVHLDENMKRLVMNYGSGFVRAAKYYVENKQYDKALDYVARGRKFIDNEIKLTEFYTTYYSSTGQWDKLDKLIDNTIFTHPDGWRIYLSYILANTLKNYPDKVIPYLRKGMLQYPSQDYFAQMGMHIATEYNRAPEIMQLFAELRPNMAYDLSYFEEQLSAYTEELKNPKSDMSRSGMMPSKN
ncbi:MAG: DUF2723 domain-containing protein [Candidatus Cloacimonetes bacterium]|nr:DUF2723 domain-containing protein [Candidatus Cloacimonadota bacterium]